ncbi:uncharacterized protein BDR25DRAFT_315666 [Lindgomyces ingoldianus]|uniref:Uncharacterized protein n=1 Tax=Lindgomyces ingoldianus TaxID=673940 RepID=A0ACB6QNR4_9PLEO|nr:uncharacterized protein BDR25DRAFT_315666 [Lindgomyces ingoldianus]KAF2468659.1 hypothetical protein BDR25DRAFT_315666 [Lindgomyces ingoldianus]
MRASIFISAPIFAIAALAQDSSSSVDAFPQTSRLTQTNSLGVITGQPAAATSIPDQPPAVTSQPAVATSVGEANNVPAGLSGINTILLPGTAGANSTRTLVVSANNSTTVTLTNATPSGSGGASGSAGTVTGTGAGASGTGRASASGSGTAAKSTGAAATMRAVAGSVAGVGAFVAAFL